MAYVFLPNTTVKYVGNTWSATDISRLQSVKTTNSQDVNATATITFDANVTNVGSDISHTSTSANFTINTTGLYEISSCVSWDGPNARIIVRTSIFVDGVENVNTRTYGHSRDTANDFGTSVLPPFEISLDATDVITLRSASLGDAGVVASVNCWIKIKRLRL